MTLAASLRPEMAAILADGRRRQRGRMLSAGVGVLAIGLAFAYAGVFDIGRYKGAVTTILTLLGDAMPPDFSRWRSWGRPLLETLSMSVAGTVLGSLAGVPLGVLAARNIGPRWLGGPIRLALNTCRSVPSLIWGVVFVAALGFGPLPGMFALACHSVGVLGKFYSEILEHVDPAPGDALRSHGVSSLGVLRFSIWPQIMPRVIDMTVYRWEHNARAATTLGVVGAGGLGLEIVTAFHLFEYQEATALIIVLLALVTLINAISGWIRGGLLQRV